MARAAEVLRPATLLIENVPTVLNDRNQVVNETKAILKRSGYSVADEVVSLFGLGVAQTRRRHILIASRDARKAPGAPSATLMLSAGGTYNGTVRFEDASDPADVEDITAEVRAEAEEHRVFYTVRGITGVTIPDNSLDTDANSAPLGLSYQVVVDAQAAGTGTIRVVLSHFDEEPKGDGSSPSDETDADVTFNIQVN